MRKCDYFEGAAITFSYRMKFALGFSCTIVSVGGMLEQLVFDI